MNVGTALRLGRISNLPTVWTNTLAGLSLSGAAFSGRGYAVIASAMTLFYVGGMYLNDAFDREHDARTRPTRPIPSGQVRSRTVFTLGFGMLGAGVTCVAAYAHLAWLPTGAALALATLIVFYDAYHKQNPLSPVVMGLCRGLVYVTAALCVTAAPNLGVWLGAGTSLSYLIVLTYTAKQEDLGRKVGWAIGYLIAGISLLDGVLVVLGGHPELAFACVAAFALTLLAQRFIPGT